MSFTRRMFGAAAGAVLAASVALPAAAQSVIEDIQKEGVIRIGLSLFVPWSMRDTNGDLIGFELDVGRQLAEDMGVEVEFVPTSWDGIIPALIGGNFDVIISGMSVTAQRNLTVNFTDPYAYSGLAILANKSMTEGMTLEDFNDPSVTFSARRGATPAAVIAKNFPEARVIATDISAGALDIAARNVAKHDLHERIELLQGDLFEPLVRQLDVTEFDLIVCNPPYVSSAEYETLDKNVKDYEPRSALLAGAD